jgi:mRNA interferase MazF
MAWIPERGDVVWITMNPSVGHEQSGRRPALVLSPAAYNGKVGLAILCPITSQVKGYPFEVALPDGLAVEGVVLSDQAKSLDWSVRGAEFACRVPPLTTAEVIRKVMPLLSS